MRLRLKNKAAHAFFLPLQAAYAMMRAMQNLPIIQEVVLANPRGFCAGVDRAVETVERVLARYGAPLYVRHEIVHNKTVVERLRAKGTIFVEQLNEVPDDALVVFSAHGVPAALFAEAQAKNLTVIDATCPLVSKVHTEAKIFHKKGFHILLIGHGGHVEVEGTMGQVPAGSVTLVETTAHAATVQPPANMPLAVLTQTTLSVDETVEIRTVLRQRFPMLKEPPKDDICYATQNRQDAVKLMAPQVDALLVVGATNSSNSNRLVDVAKQYGCEQSFLIANAQAIEPHMLAGASTVGLTAGASAPEDLVQGVIAALKPQKVREITGAVEDVYFHLPREVRVQIQAE